LHAPGLAPAQCCSRVNAAADGSRQRTTALGQARTHLWHKRGSSAPACARCQQTGCGSTSASALAHLQGSRRQGTGGHGRKGEIERGEGVGTNQPQASSSYLMLPPVSAATRQFRPHKHHIPATQARQQQQRRAHPPSSTATPPMPSRKSTSATGMPM